MEPFATAFSVAGSVSSNAFWTLLQTFVFIYLTKLAVDGVYQDIYVIWEYVDRLVREELCHGISSSTLSLETSNLSYSAQGVNDGVSELNSQKLDTAQAETPAGQTSATTDHQTKQPSIDGPNPTPASSTLRDPEADHATPPPHYPDYIDFPLSKFKDSLPDYLKACWVNIVLAHNLQRKAAHLRTAIDNFDKSSERATEILGGLQMTGLITAALFHLMTSRISDTLHGLFDEIVTLKQDLKIDFLNDIVDVDEEVKYVQDLIQASLDKKDVQAVLKDVDQSFGLLRDKRDFRTDPALAAVPGPVREFPLLDAPLVSCGLGEFLSPAEVEAEIQKLEAEEAEEVQRAQEAQDAKKAKGSGKEAQKDEKKSSDAKE